MSVQFLIDKSNFTGVCLATVKNGFVELSGYLHNNGGRDLTVAEYNELRGLNAEAVEWQEFESILAAWQRENFTSKPPVQITAEEYSEKLEVLPPENWCRSGLFEHFRMMEYTTGTITDQYARCGNVYLTKSIDVTDRTTWIKPDDFTGLKPLQEDAA